MVLGASGGRPAAGPACSGFLLDWDHTRIVLDLGYDADLYVLDATDRPGETGRAERNLLTAAEAGAWGQRAGAHQLLLTHPWPGTDPAVSTDRARQTFGGHVEVATQGLTIDLAH